MYNPSKNKISLRIIGLMIFTNSLVLFQSAAQDDSTYLKYIHPTIYTPFPDLLNLTIPTELENQQLAAKGFVDVTKGPFNADPTGQTDCTQALQAAITFARDHQMVCFFPSGTYVASNTLNCIQQLYRRVNGKVFGGNRFPNILMGSRTGTERPKIVLAPNSPGFNNQSSPRIFIDFWARGYANPTNDYLEGINADKEQPNISMNQVLMNLDIIIGEGNPGAIAVHHQAAEGSSIEECTIDATHGYIGIKGGIGSGGSSAGVKVIGGKIGLDYTGYMNGTQPTPVITGFTLTGQTEAAIKSTSRQTLVAVGLKIIADKCTGPLIQIPTGLTANLGQITLVDCSIEYKDVALAQTDRIVIKSNRGTYLHNVFVYGATEVVLDESRSQVLSGNPAGWMLVKQYAAQSQNVLNQGNYYKYPVYVDNQKVELVMNVKQDTTAPPADLQSRHLFPDWFPNFETISAINVKNAPYNAKGDGVTDDAPAIQSAVDNNEIVFLPRGVYLIRTPLILKPETKLIGAGQTLSIIVPSGTGVFTSQSNPQPLIRTANSPSAETVIAFLGLRINSDTPGAQFLHWQSGEKSIFRGVEFTGVTNVSAPVLMNNNCGGRFYNIRGGTWNTSRIVIENNGSPISFYHYEVQHLTSSLKNASNIRFYGLKHETAAPMLNIQDSDSIFIFGHGGNAKGAIGASLFIIERTKNFLFANCVDGPVTINNANGNTDPNLWNFLWYTDSYNQTFKLPVLERPVLYILGNNEVTEINERRHTGTVNQVLLYPNPARGRIYLDMGINGYDKGIIYLYDAAGRIVTSAELKTDGSNIQEIPLASGLNGLFYIKIITARSEMYGKFIVI